MQSAIQQAIEQTKQEIEAQYLAAFNQLADGIEYYLISWGADLCSAHDEFQAAIQHSESYFTARDLFDFIQNDGGLYSTQSTTKPITITPYRTRDGKTGLLITLGGTDLTDWSWDTDLFTALQTGQGFDNPYLTDAKLAIQSYMQEHREMAGSEISFAGYSLGGMTVQQMAKDIAGGNDPYVGDYNFHVAQVITYGAPVMGARLNHVQYNMYDATYDPVPLLSSYENPALNQIDLPLNIPQLEHDMQEPGFLKKQAVSVGIASKLITDTYMQPWNIKLNSYIDPKSQYVGRIHNINDVGNYILGDHLGHGGIPVFQNHMEYQDSNQLNAYTTATGVDAASFGPSEYFSMKDTNNFFVKLKRHF